MCRIEESGMMSRTSGSERPFWPTANIYLNLIFLFIVSNYPISLRRFIFKGEFPSFFHLRSAFTILGQLSSLLDWEDLKIWRERTSPTASRQAVDRFKDSSTPNNKEAGSFSMSSKPSVNVTLFEPVVYLRGQSATGQGELPDEPTLSPLPRFPLSF